MNFKTDTLGSEERNVIEPISSVSPSKSKKRTLTNSVSKRKIPSKSKGVKLSISVSEKTHKTIDIEATLKIDVNGAFPEVEKGNPDKNLNSIVSKSGGN